MVFVRDDTGWERCIRTREVTGQGNVCDMSMSGVDVVDDSYRCRWCLLRFVNFNNGRIESNKT